MNNNSAISRALITYLICLPLAIIVGDLVVQAISSPDRSNIATIGMVGLFLALPILLRWHYPLLIFCWSFPLVIFFLPGNPVIFFPMMALSLGISVLQRTMNQNMRFIHAPQITLPLVALMVVVLVTAKLTGGIGLHSLGDQTMGGKKYVYLLAGIAGYFALTARRIEPHQVRLYVSLFFLSACFYILGDLIVFLPGPFHYLFYFFPPDSYALSASESGMRFQGASQMSFAIFSFMLARHGIRGIFLVAKPWRAVAFIFFFTLGLFGGYRSFLLNCAMLFSILFFLGGLHRTRLLPLFAFVGLLAALIVFPLSDRLPTTFQRALSFLPVKIDPVVRMEAQNSTDWRIQMWEALLPQVPAHLLLGKGYAISQEDWQMMGRDASMRSIDPADQALALSGDYHNGMFSVILPFGIWGVIAFFWFLIAGVWALHRNRLYGDPVLQTINTYLFAAFLAKVIFFFAVFGALSVDIPGFVGLLGLSVSLNGGICRRTARKSATATDESPAFSPAPSRLQPAFRR